MMDTPLPEEAEPAPIQDAPSRYGFKILIHEGELDLIAGWTLERLDRETGGDLFGFWTHSGSPSVLFTLGPGQHARHERAAFYQDREHLIAAGRQAQALHGLQHIGEWHSHHRMSLAEPSVGDVNTLRLLFERYPFQRFLLCIANIVPVRSVLKQEDAFSTLRPPNVNVYARMKGYMDYIWSDADNDDQAYQVRLGAFLFHRDRRDYERGLWVTLPGVSPVGRAMREASPTAVAPRAIRAWSAPQTTLDHDVSAEAEPPALKGWWDEPEGLAFVRALHDLCVAAYGPCVVAAEPSDGALSFKTDPKTTDGGAGFELRFPAHFPFDHAILIPLDDRPSIVLNEAWPDLSALWSAPLFFEKIVTNIKSQETPPDPPPVSDAREGQDDELERISEDAPHAREGDP